MIPAMAGLRSNKSGKEGISDLVLCSFERCSAVFIDLSVGRSFHFLF